MLYAHAQDMRRHRLRDCCKHDRGNGIILINNQLDALFSMYLFI